MSYVDDYLGHVEDVTIPDLRSQLERLESDVMRTGERHIPGAWIDMTDRDIQRFKQAIAEYESILVRARSCGHI